MYVLPAAISKVKTEHEESLELQAKYTCPYCGKEGNRPSNINGKTTREFSHL